jgi:ABC-2 type transport system ATP-binding protein
MPGWMRSPLSSSSPPADRHCVPSDSGRDALISIDVRALSKLHGAAAALLDVTFTIAAGTLVKIAGAPGAGKSTLLKLLAGHMMPSGGRIRICGIDAKSARFALTSRIGYVPQVRLDCGDMRPADLLEFSGRARQMSATVLAGRIGAVAERCEIRDVLQIPYRQLRDEVRARVLLAQALLHSPDVLLLDEFLTGLDDRVARSLELLLEQLRGPATVLLTGPPPIVRFLPGHGTLWLDEGRLASDQGIERQRASDHPVPLALATSAGPALQQLN